MKRLTVLLLMAVCSGGAAQSGPRSPTATGIAPVQLRQVALTYAKGFSIEYFGEGFKKVTDGEGRELLLVPRGKQAPDRYRNLRQIQIPVQRVVILAGAEAALLRPLRVLDTVVGTSQDRNWYIQEMEEGLERGKVAFVGASQALDYEKVLSLKPDVVFLYTRSGRMNEVLTKLDELRIPAAVDNEYLEQHPLGRLEWIKLLATFYNKDDEAKSFFEQSQKRIEDIRAKTRNIANKPRVFWATLVRDGKIFVAKSGQYDHMTIELAGGNNVFGDLVGEVGSGPITAEEFLARGQGADIWLNRHQIQSFQPSIKDVVAANPFMRHFVALKEGRAWKVQPWWFESLDKTDEQIQDLAAIFHPDLFPGHTVKHLTKMPRERPGT